uniref:Uncharacterized protein n=1 Tax=Anopheles minimus TaxID=112268 RepID=A0A182WN38_9DIPT
MVAHSTSASEEECVALRIEENGRCNAINYQFGAAGDEAKRAGAGARCRPLDAVSRAGWTVYVGGGRRRRRIGRNR